jgi:hypothetical protein
MRVGHWKVAEGRSFKLAPCGECRLSPEARRRPVGVGQYQPEHTVTPLAVYIYIYRTLM